MKKLISIFLTAVLVMSCFAVNVSAFRYEAFEPETAFRNYEALLLDVCYNYQAYCTYSDSCNEHRFAIADLNNDGIDELIVEFTCPPVAAYQMYIFTYDKDSDKVVNLGLAYPGSDFYSTGYIQVPWSHNQTPGETIYPYCICKIDFESNTICTVADAYCIDLFLFDDGSFSEYEDVDDDGILYFVSYAEDDYEPRPPITQAEYDEFVNSYIPDDALINMEYMEITIENVDSIIPSYGNDESSDNSAMLGDIDGNNTVTAADSRIVLRFAAQLEELTAEQQKLADVDMSGKVTAADARKILRVAAKLDEFDTPEPDVTPDPPVSTVPDFVYDKESYYGLYVDDAENVTPYFDSKIHYEAESIYSTYIAFYTDSTITDFCFLDIYADGEYFPYGGDTIVTVNRSFGELSTDCLIVIRMQFGEILPVHGISFTDADGVHHMYALNQSGDDGSVYLSEFY